MFLNLNLSYLTTENNMSELLFGFTAFNFAKKVLNATFTSLYETNIKQHLI